MVTVLDTDRQFVADTLRRLLDERKMGARTLARLVVTARGDESVEAVEQERRTVRRYLAGKQMPSEEKRALMVSVLDAPVGSLDPPAQVDLVDDLYRRLLEIGDVVAGLREQRSSGVRSRNAAA